jgi:hypothetical protein
MYIVYNNNNNMSTNGSDTSIDSQGISIVSQSVNPHPLQRKNAQIIQTGQQTATPPNTDPTKKEGYLTSL